MHQAIFAALRQHRFSLHDEKAMQAEMFSVLVAAGFEAEREVVLSDADRIDILVGTVGIECKIKGQRRAIYHQVERYARHDRISALILATNVAMGMPPQLSGKPVLVLNLARAWL